MSTLGTHLLCKLGQSLSLSEHQLFHFQGGRKQSTYHRCFENSLLLCVKSFQDREMAVREALRFTHFALAVPTAWNAVPADVLIVPSLPPSGLQSAVTFSTVMQPRL